MKRLWIPLGILAGILAATLYNAHFLNVLTSDLTAILTRAEERAAAEDWPAAEKLTLQARRSWNDHTVYLHIFLRHSNTDDVELGFQEVQALIAGESADGYAPANARLICAISLLYEAEQLSIKNVL